MLKSNRRVGTKLFDEIMKRGRIIHSPHFLFRVITDGGAPGRISVVASKKLDSRAVHRNRARRRVYAALRKHIDEVPNGIIGVLHAKKQILTIPYSELEGELSALLKKTKIT